MPVLNVSSRNGARRGACTHGARDKRRATPPASDLSHQLPVTLPKGRGSPNVYSDSHLPPWLPSSRGPAGLCAAALASSGLSSHHLHIFLPGVYRWHPLLPLEKDHLQGRADLWRGFGQSPCRTSIKREKKASRKGTTVCCTHSKTNPSSQGQAQRGTPRS